jgi:hypothetical protein
MNDPTNTFLKNNYPLIPILTPVNSLVTLPLNFWHHLVDSSLEMLDLKAIMLSIMLLLALSFDIYKPFC